MLRRFVPALLLAAPLFAAAPPPARPDVRPLASANNAFARDLYKQLRTAEGNLIFAPGSVASALTLTTAGAAGRTRDQLAAALRSPADALTQLSALDAELQRRNGTGLSLRSVSRVWADRQLTLRPEFEAHLRDAGAAVERVGFSADPESARNWVNVHGRLATGGKVAEVLPAGSVTPLTRVVVTSAVHFKGDWAVKFKASQTAPGEFRTAKGVIKVPLMRQTGRFALGSMASGPVLELPYAGDQVGLVLAVPGDGKRLADVEREMIAGKLDAALAKAEKQRVDVILPKFKLASSLELPVALRGMGVEDAFGKEADFSGIDGTKDLYISGVYHKAAMEVSEEGTEAAAATAVVIALRSLPPKFYATQPFVFAIRDRVTGSLLFLGRVVDPSR